MMRREQSGEISHSDRRKDTTRYNRRVKEDRAEKGSYIWWWKDRSVRGRSLLKGQSADLSKAD